jgi:hypothetical protein
MNGPALRGFFFGSMIDLDSLRASRIQASLADPQAATFMKQFARELRNPIAARKAKGGKPNKTAE